MDIPNTLGFNTEIVYIWMITRGTPFLATSNITHLIAISREYTPLTDTPSPAVGFGRTMMLFLLRRRYQAMDG